MSYSPQHNEYPFDPKASIRYGLARSLDRSQYYIYDRWNKGKIVMRELVDSLCDNPPAPDSSFETMREQMQDSCRILNND